VDHYATTHLEWERDRQRPQGRHLPAHRCWRATLGPIYVLSAAAPIHRFDPTAEARTEDDLRPLAFAICYDPEDTGYWGQHAGRILLTLMLAAKQSGQPVFPFVARAIRAGAAQALGMLAEVDPVLADRVRPYGHGGSGPFPSAWETLVTRCDSLLSPVTLATMSGRSRSTSKASPFG
jgi:hypothetical protein